MAFGINQDKLVDRAVEKIGPYIERGFALFADKVDKLDASIDALAKQQERTNTILNRIEALEKVENQRSKPR